MPGLAQQSQRNLKIQVAEYGRCGRGGPFQSGYGQLGRNWTVEV
jgi:hypothetical protein